MIYLRQSTASQEITLGPFVDSTDGNTAETGLTIANTDIKIRKSGATTLANKNSGGGTHISGGVYSAVLDATDTDTLGSGEIYCQVSGALYVKETFTVLPAQVYDSLILGSDLLQVDVTQVGGTAQTAGDIIGDTNDIQARLPAALVSGRIDASIGAVASNAITAAALASDAGAEIASAVRTELTTELSRIDAAITTRLAGASYTAPDNTSIAAILVDTAEIGVAGAGLTALASATNLATVAGYLDTEIAAIKTVTDKVDTALVLDGAVYQFTANALELAPTGGSAPTAAAIADAVWDEALSGHLSSGSTGEALSAAGSAGDPWITALPGSYTAGQAGYILGTNLNATVSSRASQTSLDTVDDFLDTEIAAIKAKTDNLPASPAATGDIPTATQNADALLNRDMSAVSDTNGRSPLNALRFLRNKWSLSGSTLTVTKEDDTTSAWTASVTTQTGADPITGSDPA